MHQIISGLKKRRENARMRVSKGIGTQAKGTKRYFSGY